MFFLLLSGDMRYPLFIGIIFASAFFAVSKEYVVLAPLPESFSIKTLAPKNEAIIVAVGDIMLGRYVEDISLRNGWNYPFASTTEIFSGADIVFGNMEGTIPDEHEKTPNYGWRFSFDKESVKAARHAGVNVVTLANNHSTDFGGSGYEETVSSLTAIGIASVGKHSDYLYEKNGIKIRFMGWNDTFASLSLKTVSDKILASKKENEFLIVAVHFGEEYATSSTSRQKELARAMIDAGADVVIGSHPHVVEEKEIYHGKSIFYSLGNFIFDQYFSEETQKGLAVKMTITGSTVKYEMMPISLHKSRPQLDMNAEIQSFSLPRVK